MAPRKRENSGSVREFMKMITCVTQFGISMLVPVIMCFFVGLWLDKKLDTSYIAIVLFFVGAVAGARNVYILAKKYSGEGKE